jgi:hypothetical protein
MDDTGKILGSLGKGLGKAVGSEVKNIAGSTFEQLGVSSPTGEKKTEDTLSAKKPVDEKERKKLLEGLYGKNDNDSSKTKEQPLETSDPSLASQTGTASNAAENARSDHQEEQLKKQKLENLRSRLHQEAQRLGEAARQESTVQDRLEHEEQEKGQKKQIEAIEERKKAPIIPPRKGPERKLGIGG